MIERLGLRADVLAFDLVGQGCAAALPNLRLGPRCSGDGGREKVLSVCVEMSSAAMYLDDDPGVLISACLFGDGAGAAVLSRDRPGHAQPRGASSGSTRLADRTGAAQGAEIENRDGMLRNILTRAVPALAAEYAAHVLKAVLYPVPASFPPTSPPGSCMPAAATVLALEKRSGSGPAAFATVRRCCATSET